MSADPASGDKLTAAVHVVWPGSEKATAERKDNIDKLLRVRRTIAKPRTVVDMA